MSKCLGPMTAAVFLAFIGDPAAYPAARTLHKRLGLNLRERSSGQCKGQLKLTKRGNPHVRRWIYLAALRLIRNNAVVAAWAEHKASLPNGAKMKAVVAVMRKLVSALRHVAQGEPFDASKLFDVRRLKRLGRLPKNFHAAPAT